ncbi:hypothetical protein E2542_SST27135 [Spatholobus suberectus]|nr:hypothetical protein E2542_SST27135 [Spatholobus suberectus]
MTVNVFEKWIAFFWFLRSNFWSKNMVGGHRIVMLRNLNYYYYFGWIMFWVLCLGICIVVVGFIHVWELLNQNSHFLQALSIILYYDYVARIAQSMISSVR